MDISDSSRYVMFWRIMDPKDPKIVEAFKRMQEQRGKQVIDPSQVKPMEDTLEIHTYDPVSATYKPNNPAASTNNVSAENTASTAAAAQTAAASGESVDVSWDVKVDVENKYIETGVIKSGSMQLQGIGYRINDDWSLTPFISYLPADDPNSALPFFEKQLFGKNTGNPFENIMKYLTGNLSSMQEKFPLGGNRTVL